MSLSKLQEVVMDREAWHAAVYWGSNNDWVTELNWTKRQEDKSQISFPFLHKIKRRFLLKLCVAMTAPGYT